MAKHARGAQEAYPQYNIPLVHENETVGGPGNTRADSGAGNLPVSSSGDDEANSDLLAAWMQRLQILTVVTAFLASMDGELFSLSALNTQIGLPVGTVSRDALVVIPTTSFNLCIGILGYIASFALIRYKIIDAASENDTKVEGIQSSGPGTGQPARRLPRRIVLEPVHPLHSFVTFLQRPDGLRFLSVSRSSRFSQPPPLSLLTHCYYTTLWLSTVGFILALIGILAYIWAGLPVPVGIFSTVCLGIAISAGVWALAL